MDSTTTKISETSTSNNPPMDDLSNCDKELPAKLEEKNRQIPLKEKNSVTSLPSRSRLGSLSSQTSLSNQDSDLSNCDKELLAKLEEANRRIQFEEKNSITSLPSRSRLGSLSSQTSISTQDSGPSSTQYDQTKASKTLSAADEELWNVWANTVNNWDHEWKRRKHFVHDLLRKGVPRHFRGIVWQLLAGATEENIEKRLFPHYIKAKSACEKVIRRDISRTFPEHDFFKQKDGQESLFNVIKAYSLHDREVGYCQGSAFIVGLLLMQMPEEEAFAVLVHIMRDHRMRDMFKPSMAELGLCMYQLENIIQDLLPEVYVHFQSQGFSTSIYASSWFLTLFTTTLSIPLSCRIMDVFLSDGMEIIFKVAIALLTLGQSSILSLDMENILKYIQKELPLKADSDPDSFMQLVFTINIDSKNMKRLEKQYSNIKSKEQADIASLRCLRQENHILKQRVDHLEKESCGLAERLVKGQVDRAEGAEEAYALARDLQAIQKAYMIAQNNLISARDKIRSLELKLYMINNSRTSSLESSEMPATSELAQCLQKELIKARLQIAEREAMERELNERIAELENENKSLRLQRVDNNVAHLQDELIAVKLREAEANLSLKELRQNLNELSENWNKYMEEKGKGDAAIQQSSGSEFLATSKKFFRALEGRTSDSAKEEEAMSSKIREVETAAEIKELHLKLMELETQIQVSTNQLRRKDEECREMKEQLEAALQRERTYQAQHKELLHKIADIDSKAKYDSMQANIKSMEDAQKIAELETEVSEYKIKNEVMATEGELRMQDVESENIPELQDRIAELSAEVLRLKGRKSSRHFLLDDLSYTETDDGDELESNLKLHPN